MKKLSLLILTSCILTGCGAYGEPLFLAKVYDATDSCQSQNWHQGQPPRYCGAGSNRTYIYSTTKNAPLGELIGYIKKN